MSKVIKKLANILLHTLSGVVLVVILLILAVAIAFSMPRVQTFAADEFCSWLNNRCGVNISVGAISLENITRLTAEELYVEDLAGDTLLWASKASCKIDRRALLHEGRFVPYGARVEDAKFYIIEGSDRGNNIDKFILHIEQHFPSDTTSSGGIFTIEDIEAVDVRFRLYNQHLAGSTPEGSIDYSDMDIMVRRAKVGEIVVDGRDVILHNISELTAEDKSGAEIHDSSLGKLWVGWGLLDFRDIDFHTGSSHLNLPYLVLSAPDWRDYKEFCDRVNLSLDLRSTIVEPRAAGKWVAELGYLGLEGKEINGTFDGAVNDFVADITATLYDSKVSVVGGVKQITHPEDISAEVDLTLATTPSKVRHIYRSLVHEPMPEDIDRWVEKFDTLNLSARAQAEPSKIITIARLDTDLGGVDINGELQYGASRTSFDGIISTDGVEVGRLLDVEMLGRADVNIYGNVAMQEGKVEGSIDATATRLGWGDYTLGTIDLNATLTDSLLHASLSSHDPNALLFAEGEGVFSPSEPEYNLNLNVERVNFWALGMGKSERREWLSGNMEATLRGTSLDDMVGRAMINNFTYASASDTLSTELINLSLAGREGDKSFSLYSPIADVEYRSTASFADVLNYLTKTFPSQLPLGNAPIEERTPSLEGEAFGERLYAAEDHTAVVVNIKEGESLVGAIVPGANLAPDSSVSVEFSPKSEEVRMLLESDYVALDDIVISRLRVEANGRGDLLNLEAECDELLAMGLTVPDVDLSVGASDGNKIDLSLFFSSGDSALSGRLAANALLSRTQEGEISVVGNISDSYLVSPSQRWDIAAQEIEYSPEGIFIEKFGAENGTGGVYVDGELSHSKSNSLILSVRDVQVGEWVSLLAGVKGVTGVADGEMRLYSALSKPYGEGALTLSTLSAGGVKVDPLELIIDIPKRTTNIRAELSNRFYDTTLAVGRYDYSSGEYGAKVKVGELDLSLVNPLVTDLGENIRGLGSIDLNIEGKRERMNIDGNVAIKEFGGKVCFTGVEYHTPQMVINFDNNRGTIAPVRIEDNEGGWAEVEGTLSLEDLTNIGFNISLVPHNILAINLDADSGSPFYGKVYASGGTRLVSESGNTVISGALSTGAGSVFNLPLTGNNDFAGADFVTFVDLSEVQTEESNRLVALKKNELRKRKLQRVVGNTTVDMMLGVDTNTLLRLILDAETDNVIEARGTADLGVALDVRKSEFAIRGDYEIADGVYNFNFQDLITKQFTINPNSYIRWNGNPLDANIDVGATYKLKTSLAPLLGGESTASRASTPVECIVNLTGSLARVDVSFDINVPNANTEYQSILSSYFSSQEMMATQFVYLLTLGNFYSDTSSGQTNTASAAGTAIGMEFLAGQVSRLVSNDAYKFNLNYKAIDDTSSSYSIDFETEIIDDRLLLELEANVDTGDYYQLGGDGNQLSGGGAITLLLDNSGDFYLRGFSRTIDRFDENQGLQENGVGLYYKRSFNRLSDLWRKKKNNSAEDSEKSGNFVTTTSPEGASEQSGTPEQSGTSEQSGAPEHIGAPADASEMTKQGKE